MEFINETLEKEFVSNLMTLLNSQTSFHASMDEYQSKKHEELDHELDAPKSIRYSYSIIDPKMAYSYIIKVYRFDHKFLDIISRPYYETKIDVKDACRWNMVGILNYVVLNRYKYQTEQAKMWNIFDGYKKESEVNIKKEQANILISDMRKGFSKAVVRDEKLEKIIN